MQDTVKINKVFRKCHIDLEIIKSNIFYDKDLAYITRAKLCSVNINTSIRAYKNILKTITKKDIDTCMKKGYI